ncbi:MAG: hypothetical protein H0W63_00705 [Gemmatimonadaceae bacterium]|nr:hypothetical protein [Gemmatimonadaceae bacterium]
MKLGDILRRTITLGISLAALAACAKDVKRKESVSDSASTAPVVTTIQVNRGTQGMSERVSWMFSADKKSVLVIADPSGAEADAIPNGFVFGDEATGFQARMDSVWDVAVSPDWKTLAFSRAYQVVDGSGTSDPVYLSDLARRTSIDTAALRAASFASSGMSSARSVAQAGIIRVPVDAHSVTAGDSAAPRMFPIARGWRVRWTADGALIALGNTPTRSLDAEPSESWTALDPKTGEFHGSLPSTAKILEPQMSSGPVLHGDSGPDVSKAPPIKAMRDGKQLTITSERGVITISSAADSGAAPYVVGPGAALAATAGGGFIVALAPRAKVSAGEMPVEVVVYRVSW